MIRKLYMKPYWVIIFISRLIYEIILANIRVAYDVLTPRLYARPGVIAVPLDATTDFEILVLSIVISLTPGTLVLDVTEDKKFLFMHVMSIDDKGRVIRHIKSDFERLIMEILA